MVSVLSGRRSLALWSLIEQAEELLHDAAVAPQITSSSETR